MIARFCRGPEGSAIVRMASANNWTEIYGSIETFRVAMLRSRKRTLSQKLKDLPRKALYLFRRLMQPTGCWIAFIGPDGCGKSLVLDAVSRQFAPAFRTIRHDHMRSWVPGRKPANPDPGANPHEQTPNGLAASIVKVIELWAGCTMGYLARILPDAIRTNLTLFDRCFDDLLVDSKPIRYGGPPWLLRAAARISPNPDLVIVLDAPPEILWARKREVSFEELARKRVAYLELARSLPTAVVVNAAQGSEQVIHDAIEAVADHLARRARKRLHLPTSSARVPDAGARSSRL
jgi:thymidylate kinase